MAFYDTFVAIGRSPKTIWKSDLQDFVDQEFMNASSVYDIEEENDFGTLEFHPVVARVTSLVDAKTGQRINDDYKKITFSDLTYQPKIGTRYRFDNNVWIAFSTDNIKTDTSAVYVRRCNNTMNTQDKYGNIHEEPIYIDYKVTENQLFRNYSIDVPSGRIYFQCQKNQYTDKIEINDRFIFGSEVYKVREISKFDRRETFNRDTSYLMSCYADYDNAGENDNFELGVANYVDYNYKINVNTKIDGCVGDEGEIDVSVSLDGTYVNEPLEFISSDTSVAVVDAYGIYKLIGVGACTIECKMRNKQDVVADIDVTVKERPVNKYEYIITPDTDVIKLNKTVQYTIYETYNNERTDATFRFDCENVPERCYLFSIIDGNNFAVSNLRQYNGGNLLVHCKPVTRNQDPPDITISIRLGGIL